MTEEWEQCKKEYTTRHPLTEDKYLLCPPFSTDTFAAYEEGECFIFVLWAGKAIYKYVPNGVWKYNNNEWVTTEDFQATFPYHELIESLDPWEEEGLFESKKIHWSHD
jgi:hypothetical protein